MRPRATGVSTHAERADLALVSPVAYEVEMNWPMLLATTSTGLVLMALSWWSISETLQVRNLPL